MDPRISVIDRQDEVALDLSVLNDFAARALEFVLGENPVGDGGDLAKIEEIEVSLVSEDEIVRVHREFMGIGGATDVITFQYGEILVCPAVAEARRGEFGDNSLEREVGLYILHGLLHLHGHDDKKPEVAQEMAAVQDALMERLWPASEDT